MAAVNVFQKFLARVLRASFEDDPVTDLELRHAMGASDGSLGRVRVEDPAEWDDQKILEVASQFADRAEEDAGGFGSIQSYVIAAFRGPGTPERSPVVRIAPDVPVSAEVQSSEPPTERGMVTQLMRHNEAMARTLVASQQAVHTLQVAMIKRLSDHSERLEERNIERLEAIEKMISGEHSRQLAERESERRAELMGKAFDQLKTFAPVVVAKLGGKTSAVGDDPRIRALVEVAGELPPEKLQQIMAILGPKGAPLLDLLVEVAEGMNKERSAAE